MEQTNESYNLSQLLSIFLDTEVVTIVNENNEVVNKIIFIIFLCSDRSYDSQRNARKQTFS